MAASGTSASFSSTKETTNYARLCRLLVGVGSEVIRVTFDKIHPPASLHTILTTTYHSKLQALRKKVLNATQWGKLYPAIRTSVSSRDFDITLLTILLRNICGLTPPARGWDALPSETDVSTEANIARVKYFRNTVYGHADQASVDDATFNVYWKEIRDALVSLGGTKYEAAIDDLKNECMDPEIADHFEELLKQWKKDEDNIKDVLEEINRKLEKLTTSTSTSQPKEFEEINDLIETIRKLYNTREGRLSPFPWCEEFNFGLNDIFTKPTIVTRDKAGRSVAEQIDSTTGVFKPRKDRSKPRTVLIEGEPGMGKTTYCQKVAYDWANGLETEESFPTIELLLFLRCCDMSGSIWEAIDDQLLPKDIEADAKENFFKFIRANQSQVLFVLDGLDEAPSNLSKMFIDLVQGRELPKCHIILTSRQEGGVTVSKYCDSLLHITGFSTEHARSFITRYFDGREALGQRLLSEIERKKELLELTMHPLTTALLCLLGEDYRGTLPSSKTELYLEIASCVFRRFRRKKGLSDVEGNLIDFYKDDVKRLGRLAFKGLIEDQLYLQGKELGGSASEIPVFEFLSVHTNRSKRRPCLDYAFIHKSFQDFFAGFFLANQILSGVITPEVLFPKDGSYLKFELAHFFAFGIISLKSEERATYFMNTIVANINQSNDFLASYLSYFALKCIRDCFVTSSILSSQLLLLFGTKLQRQNIAIFDGRCDIPLLAEALRVNTTLKEFSTPLPLYFPRDTCAVSLARTLQVNQTLEQLHLLNNFTSAVGVQQLVDVLMVNSTLHSLSLAGNALQDDSAGILAEYLRANKTLVCLNLGVNGITDRGATFLAESLRQNTTLKYLILGGNLSFGNPGVLSLCETLRINNTLAELNLSGSGIDDVGINLLLTTVRDRTTLTGLNLSYMKMITKKSIRSVAEFLRVDSSLVSLYFQGNKVSVGGTRLIAESLKVNKTLKILELSRNNIRAPGAHFLSEALKANTALVFLGLSQNALRARGAQLISDGLGVNSSLTELDLSANGIGPEGVQSIAQALKINKGLIGLNLSSNAIGDSGAKTLCQALKGNQTLATLLIAENGIEPSGAKALSEVRKTNSTLHQLYLGGNNIGESGFQALSEAGFQLFLPSQISCCTIELTLSQ